jgi:DNA mismatch endonuclease (patch repair protein)
MADRVTAAVRSKIMRSVKSRDTGPELALRKALHRLGYRYRTHESSLPGRPDLVFPRYRCAIFVHGCFWHGHSCRWGAAPKSRPEFWGPKIARNRRRDRRNLRALRLLGWRTLVVWQCQLKDFDRLAPKIARFLSAGGEERSPNSPRFRKS